MSAGELREVDLVIGFEPAHVAAAVVDGGASVARAFTLVELVELLREVRPDMGAPSRFALAIERAAAARRSNVLSAASIADPLGGTLDHVRRTAELIDELVTELAEHVFGVEGTSSRPPATRRGTSRGERLRLAFQRRGDHR